MALSEKRQISISRRVLRGVDFWDQCEPGWRDRLDSQWFDMSSNTNDLLGQLCGNYSNALSQLGISEHMAVKFGFSVPHLIYGDDASDYLNALTSEWRKYLPEKKAA